MSADLLRRIGDLEEENRYLREFLAPTVVLPRSWRLSPSETRLVVVLARCEGCLAFERIRIAIGRIDRDVSDKTISVHLFRARCKLRQHGVEILSVNGIGLTMPPESRAIVRDALAAIAAGTVA